MVVKAMKIKKAVIPAAGMGTRFLPVTKAMPKEMLPIVDKPTLQLVVEEIVAAGIEDILIITGRGKSAIEDHFDRAIELENLLAAKGKEEELDQIKKISSLANIFMSVRKSRSAWATQCSAPANLLAVNLLPFF
jgi:UTP--glucose-1-phosphate uridylyltransferase